MLWPTQAVPSLTQAVLSRTWAPAGGVAGRVRGSLVASQFPRARGLQGCPITGQPCGLWRGSHVSVRGAVCRTRHHCEAPGLPGCWELSRTGSRGAGCPGWWAGQEVASSLAGDGSRFRAWGRGVAGQSLHVPLFGTRQKHRLHIRKNCLSVVQ